MTHTAQPQPLSSRADLALRALLGQGVYGVVTELARTNELNRSQVYAARERARAAVELALGEPEAPPERGTFTLTLTEADMARTAVALRVVTPSSIRDEVAMLPLIYGFGWSYGKVWGVLDRASEQARTLSQLDDLAGIEHVALDEMFSQAQPVLAGIDLDTQYLFQLEVCPDRSGETWKNSLARLRDKQQLNPSSVVKDAGTGLASGVTQCWPEAEQRDDLFHVVYEMGKVAFHLESRAYGTLTRIEEMRRKQRRTADDDVSGRRSLGQQLGRLRKDSEHAISRYDSYEALRRQAARALQLADRDSGRVRTSQELKDTLQAVAAEMKAIKGEKIRKVATYLHNRAAGLGTYLDEIGAQLCAVSEETGRPDLTEATVRAWQASHEVHSGGPKWDHDARKQSLNDATRHLLKLGQDAPEALRQTVQGVLPALARRHRASSAIENLNSVLRPYLVVQKHAPQGFLELFRFFWNNRAREWGRWKGTSPLEQLTGRKQEDWLTRLGFPPGEGMKAALAASRARATRLAERRLAA